MVFRQRSSMDQTMRSRRPAGSMVEDKQHSSRGISKLQEWECLGSWFLASGDEEGRVETRDTWTGSWVFGRLEIGDRLICLSYNLWKVIDSFGVSQKGISLIFTCMMKPEWFLKTWPVFPFSKNGWSNQFLIGFFESLICEGNWSGEWLICVFQLNGWSDLVL